MRGSVMQLSPVSVLTLMSWWSLGRSPHPGGARSRPFRGAVGGQAVGEIIGKDGETCDGGDDGRRVEDLAIGRAEPEQDRIGIAFASSSPGSSSPPTIAK